MNDIITKVNTARKTISDRKATLAELGWKRDELMKNLKEKHNLDSIGQAVAEVDALQDVGKKLDGKIKTLCVKLDEMMEG